jgi:acetylglutamate kinase
MTLVIKIGGRAQSNPNLAAALATLWPAASSNGGMIVVHGGGDEVTALQAAFGGTSSFVGGRRVTSARDVDLVRMALSGSANKRLVAALTSRGIEAVGVSGEDATLISATPIDPDRFGFVGAPTTVNVRFLNHLLSGGYLPVVSPVSRSASSTLGPALNVNGDDAAAAIAVAVGASELMFVSDVAGVLRDGVVLPLLTPAVAAELLADGVATDGMSAKLDAGLRAAAAGVRRVRISDIDGVADAHRGTFLQHVSECSTQLR